MADLFKAASAKMRANKKLKKRSKADKVESTEVAGNITNSATTSATKNAPKNDENTNNTDTNASKLSALALGQIATVDIDAHDHSGNALCLSTSPITLVENALAGETCTVKIKTRSKRINVASLVKIIKPSPKRTKPFCDLIELCGGCSMQHVSAQDGLETKSAALKSYLEKHTDIIFESNQTNKEQSLAHNAHLTTWYSPVKSLIVYDEQVLRDENTRETLNKPQKRLTHNSADKAPNYAYRRRIKLAIDARNKDNIKIGFRQANSNKIVNVRECPISVAGINHILPNLTKVLRSLPSVSNLGHVVITQGKETLLIALYTVKPLCKKSLHILDAFKQDDAFVLSIIQKQSHQSASSHQKANNQPIECLAQSDEQIIEDLDGIRLSVGSRDFLQVNADVNRQMLSMAIQWLTPTKQDTLYDFFCGAGNFALAFSSSVKKVMGYEGLQSMVDKAAKNAQDMGVNNCDFSRADLSNDTTIQALGINSDAIVLLDPSREGALALCGALCDSKVKKILYVSCNANSFARDCKVLQASYHLQKVCALDMFPFTKHLELMALFTLKS